MTCHHLQLNGRSQILIGVGLVTAALAWGFGDSIRQALQFRAMLQAETVTVPQAESMISQASDPFDRIQSLWRTGKIPHREAAIRYLRARAPENDRLWRAAEPLVLRATQDADLNVRETALAVLEAQGHPDLPAAIRCQLEDPDPYVRRLGLQYLRRLNDPRWTALAVQRLGDQDPSVASTAATLLRRWTDQDFGIRHRMTVNAASASGSPDNKPDGEIAKPHEPDRWDPQDRKAFKQGLSRWRDWWQAHQADYPAMASMPEPLPIENEKRLARDFRLPDLDENLVHLYDFQGRPVLLNFWATWCPACRSEIPHLVDLKDRWGDDLVILGISLDQSPDGHTHEPHEDSPGSLSEGEQRALKEKIKKVVRDNAISYRILHDPQGRIGRRFNGHELPTNVLIGPEGRVHRRFVGSRPVTALDRMIREISRPVTREGSNEARVSGSRQRPKSPQPRHRSIARSL